MLALLEGIDVFREDWMAVRDHVNAVCHNGDMIRSREDCIIAFLRSVVACHIRPSSAALTACMLAC